MIKLGMIYMLLMSVSVLGCSHPDKTGIDIYKRDAASWGFSIDVVESFGFYRFTISYPDHHGGASMAIYDGKNIFTSCNLAVNKAKGHKSKGKKSVQVTIRRNQLVAHRVTVITKGTYFRLKLEDFLPPVPLTEEEQRRSDENFEKYKKESLDVLE